MNKFSNNETEAGHMSKMLTAVMYVCLFLGIVNSAHSSTSQLPISNETVVFEPIFQSQIYLYEAGINKTNSIVLVHGVGDRGARVWDSIIPELAKKYHVVTFDLPGFGRSSKKNVLYSPTLYAAFVKWVVDRYVDGPFVLIGHSLGGAVALRFASAYQRNLQRLILIDVAGVLHQSVLARHMAKSKLNDWSSKMRWPPLDILTQLSKYTIDRIKNLPIDPEMAIGSASLRRKLFNADPAKIAGLALSNEDFCHLIERVAAPTLILWGAEDTVTPIRTGKVLSAKIPNAHLKIIPNVGHCPMLEQPEQFKRLILSALSKTQIKNRAPKVRINDRIGRCDNKNGVLFSGAYRHVEVRNSRDVRLVNVRAESLTISGSEVTIETSQIEGNEVAIKLNHSSLTATAVNLAADIAILATRSRMDLAGVNIIGRKSAVYANDNSTIIFSVSHVESPHTSGNIHGLREVTPSNPL
jgi:pimeloyl-ACP methyl ester carboxylesterase